MKKPTRKKVIRMPIPEEELPDPDTIQHTTFFSIGSQRIKIDVNVQATDITGQPLAEVREMRKPRKKPNKF